METISVLVVILLGSHVGVEGSFNVPGMDREVYMVPGDLLLGALFRVHKFSPDDICGGRLDSLKQFQYHESMVFALSLVNNNQHILPNTTLGAAILDDCTNDQAAMARAMSLVPPADCCTCNSSSSAAYYQVVGVVSGTNSQNTLAAAGLLNMFNMPMVGTSSTSELLSDKLKYKNFLRVVPSDRFQAQVIIDILLHYNWTYISAINSPGGYGETGIKAVKALAEANGICIAYTREVDEGRGEDEFGYIANNLIRHKTARAVVMFAYGAHSRGIVQAVHDSGLRNHFVWITSDSTGVSNDFAGLEETGAGGFHVQLYSVQSEELNKYLRGLSPLGTNNPWMRELWEREFDCDYASQSRPCPTDKTMQDIPGYKTHHKAALFYDSIHTFAYALHAYIERNCPRSFGNKNKLIQCVNPAELLPYLYNVSFDGSYGRVRFDENGEADGIYIVEQLQKLEGKYMTVAIGRWDKFTRQLSIDKDIFWNVDEGLKSFAAKERNSVFLPESLCSKPCEVGEFYVQLELKCCWNCRKCRNNEITVDNASSCAECPLFTWPDNDTVTTCILIPPRFFSILEVLPATCHVIALIGIGVSLASLIVYIKHRNSKLIKATSRELSLIALAGNTLSYITAIFIILKPEIVICYIDRLGFNLTIGVVYASLLTKTNRIYRIFNSAKGGTQKPRLTSTRSQLIIVFVLITIQIIITGVMVVLAPPVVKMRMPIRTHKYTELLCDLPMNGFIPSLSYNLILILSCSFYAFRARKLPDNFNESRYIFFTVCTTLFLWLAFLPTYFSAFYAPQKALLLSTMLLTNASVILLCMYIPKVYAIYYVDDDNLKVQTQTASVGGDGNQITPAPTNTTTTAPGAEKK